MSIRSVTTNLTDGSEVTDILFRYRSAGGQYHTVRFPACSHEDACAFIEKIEAAIEQHTLFCAND